MSAETAARLRAFRDQVHAADHARADTLRSYARRVDALLPAATETLMAELDRRVRADEGHDLGPVASVVSMMGLDQGRTLDEPRHSLALAWLLDPGRSGRIADLFRLALLDLLEASAEPTLERDNRAARFWRDPDRARYEIAVVPAQYRAEVDSFDVWATTPGDVPGQRAGILIENKIRRETSEQRDQLARYQQRVDGAAHVQEDLCLLVFLSPERREIRSAGDQRARWHHITWSDLRRTLIALAGDASEDALSVAERVLLRQYAQVIDADIYQYRTDRREVTARLHRRLTQAGRRRPDGLGDERHHEFRELCAALAVGGA